MTDQEPVLSHQFLHLLVQTQHGHVEIVNNHRMDPEEIRRELQTIKAALGSGDRLELPWFTSRVDDVLAAWTTAG